ncbi:MAG TPA: MFS transporter [Gammaproteobacteria bacterium]|nr:MFS transporter [Gammaproteobacteria bacterium]
MKPQNPRLSFAALRHPGYRVYFATSALAMMADSIEHVISYWILFGEFRSPALGGFAVISHWLPFLLFSFWSGKLADRFDPRRIIQIGMGLFIGVSVAWGLLFLFDTLEMWHAVVLLIVHGLAGVLWAPATQLLVHDIVGPEQLHSAIRLNATARYLGLLGGPAVGSAMLLLLGPATGILVNALIYLPLILWLWTAPYGPRFRIGRPPPIRSMKGVKDIVSTVHSIGGDRVLVTMTLLGGTAALFVGNGYHPQMPEFAHDLGHGNPGLAYGLLLSADACGALTAGLVLEARGLLEANARTALILAMLWCGMLTAFSAATSYPLALALLFVVGFVELSFFAMAQTLVQLNAPHEIRGRVIGLFNMASLGMRTFSGITVGVVGGFIGIHWSLALSAMTLLGVVGCLFVYLLSAPAVAPSTRVDG